MDKKKQMQFNLNNFLISVSPALDFVMMEKTGVSLGHSKRVAYLALKIAQRFDLSPEELSDLCSYCLVHSIALIENKEFNIDYLERSNELAQDLPFLIVRDDILKYQREYFDGSGIYGLKNDEIPFFSQVLSFAIMIDEKFDLSKKEIKNREEIVEFISKNKDLLFSSELGDIFIEESKNVSFWLDLQNDNDMMFFIFSNLQDFTKPMDFEDILQVTSIFTELFDGDVQILHICHDIALYYQFEHKDIYTFLIAASLKNIGKFMISNEILNKDSSLQKDEYEQIKAYPYYTKKILDNIIGFSDVSIWASKVQEKIDRSGYPFGYFAKDLSFKDRILIVINIYDALLRKKSFREAFTHNESIEIMRKTRGLDLAIINDFEKIYG